MLAPMLLVGVGGSGGKTLRMLRQALLRKLRTAGWTSNELPQAWQLLWIDTKTVQTADQSSLPLLPANDYFGATPPQASYQGIRDAIVNSLASPADRSDALGWLPEMSPVNVSSGAGQYRALGRAVGLNRLAAIKDAIAGKHARMVAPQAQTELVSIARLLGADTEAAPPEPIAVLISSLAGGSGAGMYLDVAEAMKSVAPPLANRIHTVLYGPDVFNSIPAGGRVKIPANTLAGLSETMAGTWAPGVSSGSAQLYGTRGIPSPVGPGFGGKYTYLIGASNGLVSFTDADDVYAAVGNALVALVSDESVQDWLHTFVLMSVFEQGGNFALADETGIKNQSEAMQREPVASLGFSRVSLGTDRLREYIAEAGGHEAVRRLLWPMDDLDPTVQGGPEAQVAMRVDERWRDFLRDSGVNELNPANDVVNAINSPDMDQRFGQFIQHAVGRLRTHGANPADYWRDLVMREWENGHQEVIIAETDAQYQLAREWVASIQESFLAHVSRSVAGTGLTVTTRLLNRLSEHLATSSIEELRQEAREAQAQLGLMAGEITAWLGQGGNATLAGDDEVVERSVHYFGKYLGFLAAAVRFNLAADLLTDFRLNVLEPLAKTLREAQDALRGSVEAKIVNGDTNPYSILADMRTESVPQQLRPALTERMLIPADDIPKTAKRLIDESLSRASAGRSTERFLESCILGTPLDARGDVGGDEDVPLLFTVHATWIPGDSRARRVPSDSPQTLRVSIPTDPLDYVMHVEDRLAGDPKTRLGAFLTMGLEEFLAQGAPHEQDAARSRFAAELTATLTAGAPMRNVNATLGAVVHPGHAFTVALTSSVVPASLKDLVEPVLVNSGLNVRRNYGDADASEITFFSIDDKAINPVVLDSFMEPIARSWSQAAPSASSRATWWGDYSRARPLSEFVPLAPDVLHATIVGWFLADSLNLLRRSSPQPNLGMLVEIWDSKYSQWVAFPYPLLGVGVNPEEIELLPAILQSVALALVDVNSQGSLAPLEAYGVLRRIGEDHSRILSEWVHHAKLPGGPDGPTPRETVAGSVHGASEDRKVALQTILEQTRDYLSNMSPGPDPKAAPFETPAMWEIRDQAVAGLSELGRSLNNLVEARAGGLFGVSGHSDNA